MYLLRICIPLRSDSASWKENFVVGFRTSVEELLCRAAYSVMSNGRESGWHFVMMHFYIRNIGSDDHPTNIQVEMDTCKARRPVYNGSVLR